MIRVVCPNGGIIDINYVEVAYVEREDVEKVVFVDKLDRAIKCKNDDNKLTFEWDEEKTIEDALVMLKEENQRLRAIAEKHLNELKEEEKKSSYILYLIAMRKRL